MSGGAISSMRCMVAQPFAARGNWLYPEFYGHNRRATVPRVLDPDSSPPELSVERVARAGHSTVGRIGTHMLLRVPSRDLLV
jgi:hypothetical protein